MNNWRVTTTVIGNEKLYGVYRNINPKEIDHSGNRETAGFYNSKEKALREAEQLNYIESNTSKCVTRQMTKEEREKYFGKEEEA